MLARLQEDAIIKINTDYTLPVGGSGSTLSVHLKAASISESMSAVKRVPERSAIQGLS